MSEIKLEGLCLNKVCIMFTNTNSFTFTFIYRQNFPKTSIKYGNRKLIKTAYNFFLESRR